MGALASKSDVETVNATIQRIQSELNRKISDEIASYKTSDVANLQSTLGPYARLTDVDSKLTPYARLTDVDSKLTPYAQQGNLITMRSDLEQWVKKEIANSVPSLSEDQILKIANNLITNNTLLNTLNAGLSTSEELPKKVANVLATTHVNQLRGPPGTVGAGDVTMGGNLTVPGTLTAGGDMILNSATAKGTVTASTLNVTGATTLKNTSFPSGSIVHFGSDIPVGAANGQREGTAGQMGYNLHGGTQERPHLGIVGGGKAGQGRKVKIWDELNTTGSVSLGTDGADGKFYLNPGSDNWLRLQDKTGNYGDKGLATDNIWVGKTLHMNDNDLRLRNWGDACHGMKYGKDHGIDGPVVRANASGGLATAGCDGKGKLNMVWDGHGVWGGPYKIRFENGRCLDAGQFTPGATGSHACMDGNLNQAWDYNFATGQLRQHKTGKCIHAEGDWSLQNCNPHDMKQQLSKTNGGAFQNWWGDCFDSMNTKRAHPCKSWGNDSNVARNQIAGLHPWW